MTSRSHGRSLASHKRAPFYPNFNSISTFSTSTSVRVPPPPPTSKPSPRAADPPGPEAPPPKVSRPANKTDADASSLNEADPSLSESLATTETDDPYQVNVSYMSGALQPPEEHKRALKDFSDASLHTRKFGQYSQAMKKLVKPQLQFKRKPDNSTSPFKPYMPKKFNAIVPLEESSKPLIDPQTSEILGYPHPYEMEIEYFQPLKHHLHPSFLISEQTDLTVINKAMPQTLKESTSAWIQNPEQLVNLVKLLELYPEFAVDVEHNNFRSYLGLTCLIQISTRSVGSDSPGGHLPAVDFIIDSLALHDQLHILNKPFSNPKIMKVLHGSDSDVQWLQRDFGIYIVNLFDTKVAMDVLQLPASRSFLTLLAHYLPHADALEFNKKELQLSDWRIRPLPAEHENYARGDTHYLLYLADRLREDLIVRARSLSGEEEYALVREVFNRSKLIAKQVYVKPEAPTATVTNPGNGSQQLQRLYLKTKKVFNSRQLAALRALYTWRDRIAREEDESLLYVLPPQAMLSIAENLPRDPHSILSCCTYPVPPLVRQNLFQIFEIIKEARILPVDANITLFQEGKSSKESVENPIKEANADVAGKPGEKAGPGTGGPHDFSHPVKGSRQNVPRTPEPLAPPSATARTLQSASETVDTTPEQASILSKLSRFIRNS